MQSFLANTKGLLTLGDFHAWLFATHLCYAVERQACLSFEFTFGETCLLHVNLLASSLSFWSRLSLACRRRMTWMPRPWRLTDYGAECGTEKTPKSLQH